ncbi:MAG TPA: hypothetical protein VGL73_14195 [Caulobacteraceae bacterium]|jgi:hypothetical protein
MAEADLARFVDPLDGGLVGGMSKPSDRARWHELGILYRAHVDATLPPA